MNVPRLMTFPTEEEKPETADTKNFWHARISESSKWKAKETKFAIAWAQSPAREAHALPSQGRS
jgi:hypothetical protein